MGFRYFISYNDIFHRVNSSDAISVKLVNLLVLILNLVSNLNSK